ncbi:MAG: hypothetical protein IJO79_05925 [Firmicutes bacterium]|nr:hypothetical protein [Bacillota bacterium]
MVYHKIFLFPSLVLLCGIFLSGFTAESDEALVRDLLLSRTLIMEQVLYGELSLEEGERRLAQIETQPLLKEDITAMRTWLDSDLDVVRRLKILSLEKRTGLYGYRAFDALILWEMRGVTGSYTETVEYNVVLKQSGDQYRISILEPLFPKLIE